MPLMMRIAGTIPESIVDGPGFRFALFTQGCPHHCEGCHNPETHDFAAGHDGDTDDLENIGHKIRDTVAEEPVQSLRIRIDLGNQSSRMPRGEEGIGQPFKGGKNGSLQIAGNERRHLGTHNGIDHMDHGAEERKGGNGKHQKENMPVKRASLLQDLVIQDLTVQIRSEDAQRTRQQNGEDHQ